jgi:hypothetical protein
MVEETIRKIRVGSVIHLQKLIDSYKRRSDFPIEIIQEQEKKFAGAFKVSNIDLTENIITVKNEQSYHDVSILWATIIEKPTMTLFEQFYDKKN